MIDDKNHWFKLPNVQDQGGTIEVGLKSRDQRGPGV